MDRRRWARPSLILAELFRSQLGPNRLAANCLAEVALAADRVGLAPALWGRGVRSGWWSAIPDDAAELIRQRSADPFGQPELALQAAFALNAARIDDLLSQGERIEDEFQAAGLPSVRLKGWHTITSSWWPDRAERTMTDLDVLVPADRAEEGVDILRTLGYVAVASGHTSFADHEMAPVRLPGHAGSVEVHKAMMLRRWADVLPASEVLHAGSPMTTTDAATHLIAHAQLQDEAYLLGLVPMRALYELTLLLEGSRGADVDWPLVRSRFSAVGAERAFDGFLWLSVVLFGAAVPNLASRVPLRSRVALLAIDRPRFGALVSWVAYLPRSLSADRMHTITPSQPVWRTRVVYVTSALRARVAAIRP